MNIILFETNEKSFKLLSMKFSILVCPNTIIIIVVVVVVVVVVVIIIIIIIIIINLFSTTN